jgi:hypothetical protein
MNYWRFSSTQFYVTISLFIFLFTFGIYKFVFYSIVFLFFVCIVLPNLLFGILISTLIWAIHIKFLLSYLIMFFLVVLELGCPSPLASTYIQMRKFIHLLSCICTCYLTQHKKSSSCQHMLLTTPLNLVWTRICHDKTKRQSVRL